MNSKLTSAAYRLAEVTPELPQGYWTGLYMSGLVGVGEIGAPRVRPRTWSFVPVFGPIRSPGYTYPTPTGSGSGPCEDGQSANAKSCVEQFERQYGGSGPTSCYRCCCRKNGQTVFQGKCDKCSWSEYANGYVPIPGPPPDGCRTVADCG